MTRLIVYVYRLTLTALKRHTRLKNHSLFLRPNKIVLGVKWLVLWENFFFSAAHSYSYYHKSNRAPSLTQPCQPGVTCPKIYVYIFSFSVCYAKLPANTARTETFPISPRILKPWRTFHHSLMALFTNGHVPWSPCGLFCYEQLGTWPKCQTEGLHVHL